MPLVEKLRWAVLAAAVPLAAFLAFEARDRPVRFVALVTDLPVHVIAECTQYLEGRNIPFEVKDGGHDLWVPASLRAELTIELARLIRDRERSLVHGIESGNAIER